MMNVQGPLAEGATDAKNHPNVVDTGHASPEAAELFAGYFGTKTRRELGAFTEFFHDGRMSYFDATLGIGAVLASRAGFRDLMASVIAAWGEGGRSYPVRILGDTGGAIVVFVDTPELFGEELRIIGSVSFAEGTIVRQVDYWDGRRNSVTGLRDPSSPYPSGLGVETAGVNAGRVMNDVVRELNSALAAGDAARAENLFSDDAAFEDMTTRTVLDGRRAIGRYLRRALAELPYGPDASVLHVVGNERGGGYEWVPNRSSVPGGITALELDRAHRITRLTTVWDGSCLDDAAIQALAGLSLET